MALYAKFDVDIALGMLNEKVNRMEKYQMNAEDYLQMYLQLAQEQVANAITPLNAKRVELKQ